MSDVSIKTDVQEANQSADRNRQRLTKEEEAAKRREEAAKHVIKLERKALLHERRLQDGCQLRPHVLAQEGELLESDIIENAKKHPTLPWPQDPKKHLWHPDILLARRLWMKTQKAEARLAEQFKCPAVPDVPGGPDGACPNTTAAVEGTGSSSDNGHQVTNTLPLPKTSNRNRLSKARRVAKKAARDAGEGSANSTDTRMKTGTNEDKQGSETDNSVICVDMVRDRSRSPPYPLSSYCMSAQTDRILSEVNATSPVPKPPKLGITPRTASHEDQAILLKGNEAALSHNHEQTDLRFQFHRFSPYNFPRNAAVLPVQHEAIPESQTGEVSGPVKANDTAVIGENLVCKLEDITAQNIDGSAKSRIEETIGLEEGEIMEISNKTFLEAAQQKKRKRSASALSDYSHRSPEERDEYIESLIDPARSDLVRRRATISMLPCIYTNGRSGNQSAKTAGTLATGSPATSSPFIGPSPPQRPEVRRRSTSPRGTRGETRIQAFERAKAEGLIPSEMTYTDLLRLDEQDRVDTKRLQKVHKRAWEEAGRPPRPPGFTHNSLYSYVYDLIAVPDVIRGPEAKRAKIREKGEQEASPKTSSGQASDTRVRSLGGKTAGNKSQATEAVEPATRELEVQDFIRMMSGKKRR